MFLANVRAGLAQAARRPARIPGTAPTLEWSVASPPPVYNFAVIPQIASRHPLWEDRLDEGDERSVLDRGYLLDQGKETLGVTPLDGQADVILKMPSGQLAAGSAWRAACWCSLARLLVHACRGWPVLAGVDRCSRILVAWFRPHRQTFAREEVRVYE